MALDSETSMICLRPTRLVAQADKTAMKLTISKLREKKREFVDIIEMPFSGVLVVFYVPSLYRRVIVIYTKKAQQICQTVCRVPHGKVSSYGKIADLSGLPGRARMVGKVMQFAPSEMKVPWYRVVKSNGCIAFPSGSESAKKQTGLLQEEGVIVLNNKINMKKFGWQPDLAEILMMEF